MLEKKGFTLIELIIVIAIIALLAAATFVAVNPARRVGNAQDATRYQDLMAIADAYQTYLADNNSVLPTTTYFTNGLTYMIATTTPTGANTPYTCNGSSTANRFIVLDNLISGGYIGKMPTDPRYTYAEDTWSTMYWLYREDSGKLQLGSCNKYGTDYPVITR